VYEIGIAAISVCVCVCVCVCGHNMSDMATVTRSHEETDSLRLTQTGLLESGDHESQNGLLESGGAH
jgi:hypothetical protein